MHKAYNCFVWGFVLAVLCSGCQSTRTVDSTVLSHQKQLDEYKGAVENLVRRADESAREIERIRGRADTLTGEIDGVIELFDNYQRAVEQFIRDYQLLRDKIEGADKDAENSGVGSFSTDCGESGGVCPMLQGSQTPPLA